MKGYERRGLGSQGAERRQPRSGANPTRRFALPPVGTGGALLPAPSTQIPVPQDAKLSPLAPEPCDLLEIMGFPSEPFISTGCYPCPFTIYMNKSIDKKKGILLNRKFGFRLSDQIRGPMTEGSRTGTHPQ